MKKQIAVFTLAVLAFGSWLPAQADWDGYFNRFDHNRDGRWDRREFYEANRYYVEHHPLVFERHDFGHDYYRLDRDRDGYLNRHEVHMYRNW